MTLTEFILIAAFALVVAHLISRNEDNQ